MPTSKGGDVDPAKPLLTYSRPKGEYKDAEADPIMIDFWLSNAKLKGDGGEYRVRYIIDDDDPRFIDKWEPVWLSGWLGGKHTVRLELLDKNDWRYKTGATTPRRARLRLSNSLKTQVSSLKIWPWSLAFGLWS